MRKHVRDGRSSGGDVAVIILAEECGECGGDLRLDDGSVVFAYAQRLRIGADHGDPDIFGAFLIHAVFFPFCGAAAAAMVGGDDEGGLTAESGVGFCRKEL